MAGTGNKPWWKQTKVWQYVGAGGTLAGGVALAAFSLWPFHAAPADPGTNPSVWEVLINDQWIQGTVRLGLVAVVAYVVGSVPALLIGRRWMKGLGTSGLAADEARNIDEIIEDYESTIDDVQNENQQILMEADAVMNELLAEVQALEDERDELMKALEGDGSED